MRTLSNQLGDPSLHLLAIALFVVYLAFGRGHMSGAMRPEDPLPFCKVCHVHFLPGQTCDCRPAGSIAHALP